jgi:hypothetical protein
MRHVEATILLALTTALLLGAGSRRKLWDLDLSEFTNHDSAIPAQIWGIRFSPDETKLAIGFGPSWNFDSRPRHVVVVSVDQPHIAVREFELNTTSPFPSTRSIVWSPTGATLVIRTRPPIMLRLGGAASCSFPEGSEFGGFLSGDRMVIVFRDTAEIRILTRNCSLTDSWMIDGPADVLDTSSEQDMLAVQTFLKPPKHSAIELVASQNHEIKQRWIWNSMSVFHGGFVFSDHGRRVCSANSREGKRGPDAACWDIQTGAKVAENGRVAVDWQGIVGAGDEDLLAITDYKYISHQGKFWVFFDINNDYTVAQRHVIWNVRTGEDVVSWGSFGEFYQAELWGKDLKHASTVRTPIVLSLSPTGKFIAEGGSGSVSIHSVQSR